MWHSHIACIWFLCTGYSCHSTRIRSNCWSSVSKSQVCCCPKHSSCISRSDYYLDRFQETEHREIHTEASIRLASIISCSRTIQERSCQC
ncbi:expressed protein [Batrachochytrium dendrobatidis JAM81]|uniref:Expressed protein n=1 Tax=Batrachochytrium dendrobatidis (strain JAM81 / FGSC 10211) TaxID=684364 RepID=F4P044_BATDJ|nr:uncharacterized protein BATDEDRAFT_36824 [Batrachochytrium dendrobatidis JAM81]EGF81506.1 expressed protein [Batrachochytrium dendrobatidis JAM81]|eukprot:XP_006678061.1 expressed protein [Batrachochytrium dendrobatidis JAM81]